MSDESEKPAAKPQEEQPKPTGVQQSAKSENPPNPPSFPPAKQAPANDGDSGHEHKKLTKWERFERWIRVAEFAAFIAAILTAVFIGYQWHEMVKSSKIAGRQLDVMQRQLDEMKTARELDERAWVMAYDYEPQYTSNGFFVRVSFKNTGKTPAIECEGHIFWQTNRDKIPTFDIRPPPPENRSLLAPDEGGIIDSAMFSFQDMAGIVNGSKPIFYYGTIWYDDIFGNHHWSQFCWIFGPSLQSGFLKAYSLTVHNSCDDAKTKQTN